MTHNSNKVVDAQQHYRQSSTQQSASIYRGMAGWTHWKLSRFLVTMVSMSRSKTLFLWVVRHYENWNVLTQHTDELLHSGLWWFAVTCVCICFAAATSIHQISASLFAAIRIFLVASNQVIFKSFKIFVTHSILWTYE